MGAKAQDFILGLLELTHELQLTLLVLQMDIVPLEFHIQPLLAVPDLELCLISLVSEQLPFVPCSPQTGFENPSEALYDLGVVNIFLEARSHVRLSGSEEGGEGRWESGRIGGSRSGVSGGTRNRR